MELINNFSDIFLSVWNQGILGVDIFQILIGIGIFLIFLVFRGIISKVIIKKLEIISKKTTNKLDDTFVSSLIGPARFLPIVIGFFIASYYMSCSLEGREIVDTINRTRLLCAKWIGSITFKRVNWLDYKIIKSFNFYFRTSGSFRVVGNKNRSNYCRAWLVWCCCCIRCTRSFQRFNFRNISFS